jgi:hypothetical protein
VFGTTQPHIRCVFSFPRRLLTAKRPKASDAGFDPHAYLQTDGFNVLQAQKVDINSLVMHDVFKVTDETASSAGGLFGEDAKQFHDALKSLMSKLAKLHKDVITFQWKIKKRVSAPAGALSVLSDFRNLVSDTLTFYQQFVGSELETYLDVDKVWGRVPRRGGGVLFSVL